MLGYVRLELSRQLRNPHALVFRIALPAAMFVFFRAVLVEDKPRDVVHPDADAMVVFAVLGTLLSGMLASGPSLAQERAVGWLRQLRVMPVSATAAVVGKVTAALAFALPAVALVLLAAAVTQGVELDLGRWAQLVILLWLCAAPFAAIGVTIGLAVADPEAAQGTANAAIVVLWVLGGMLTEPSELPPALETLARGLPTTAAAELGWATVRGAAVPLGSAAALLAWTAGGAAAAAFAWRRLGDGR